MLNTILFSSVLDNGITAGTFFACFLTALVLGVFIAFTYTIKNEFSKSYIITLALLPAVVGLIIMLVNGNVGTGVAIAGAFSLVRFRSAPGSGQEITSIFLAMTVGLATGMGYLGIAAIFAVLIVCANLILQQAAGAVTTPNVRMMKITVPENLDFEGVFDDLFDKYTESAELTEVKTTNMGSLYKLSYKIRFRKNASMKGLMDELRQRNGNLEISCSRQTTARAEEL